MTDPDLAPAADSIVRMPDHDASYAVNRTYWDERAPAHGASPGYRIADFLSDPQFISDVVRFDLPRLGDITGARGVHLQCHIGTDTLSLARLGARMSGLDMSPASLAEARSLAQRTGVQIDYVLADTYSAPDMFDHGAFDLVYTGVGALCWLPSIDRWAKVVATLLRPGGRLFVREGHPMLWTLRSDDGVAITVDDPYFETDEPLVWDEAGTYVPTDVELTTTISHSWNHGLAEILTAVVRNGLRIDLFEEHRTVPWQGLPQMVPADLPGEYVLPTGADRVPMSYTLVATRA